MKTAKIEMVECSQRAMKYQLNKGLIILCQLIFTFVNKMEYSLINALQAFPHQNDYISANIVLPQLEF